MYLSSSSILQLLPELNSIAFMPKTLVMKDRGANTMVTTVNIMMERPCATVSSVC